jgi:hypothetical protein
MRPEAVLRVLRELRDLTEQRRIILIGGQAVAFWSRYFEERRGQSLVDAL